MKAIVYPILYYKAFPFCFLMFPMKIVSHLSIVLEFKDNIDLFQILKLVHESISETWIEIQFRSAFTK